MTFSRSSLAQASQYSFLFLSDVMFPMSEKCGRKRKRKLNLFGIVMRTLIRKKIGLMVQWLACKPSKLAVRVQFPVKSHFLIFLFYFFFCHIDSDSDFNRILQQLQPLTLPTMFECNNQCNKRQGNSDQTSFFLLLHTYLAGFPCDQACKGIKLDDASIAQKHVSRVLLTNTS